MQFFLCSKTTLPYGEDKQILNIEYDFENILLMQCIRNKDKNEQHVLNNIAYNIVSGA